MNGKKDIIDYVRDRMFGRVDIHSSSYHHLARTQWSRDFERLMRNRLILGALRYGLLHEEGKPKWNRIASAISRLQKYLKTHNEEHLVDAANLCLLEFEEGDHPEKHLKAADDGEHVEVE